ncbi:hypothetical protein CSOJ01_08702 [Colletotrichum sojae]|uniref:Uncharacterized protein n=1 Tax=Colletotrichum sojae TaxID=2175907 RepID=A0A8H6J5P3_9PEZI|nr:hypothetical protein CSOJ01_08702 [Colletotrichum sojae]
MGKPIANGIGEGIPGTAPCIARMEEGVVPIASAAYMSPATRKGRRPFTSDSLILSPVDPEDPFLIFRPGESSCLCAFFEEERVSVQWSPSKPGRHHRATIPSLLASPCLVAVVSTLHAGAATSSCIRGWHPTFCGSRGSPPRHAVVMSLPFQRS